MLLLRDQIKQQNRHNETADFWNRPGPLTVACGLGRDSVAMFIEMVKRGHRPDMITFADVGNEHPRTYAYLSILNDYLARHDFPLVTVIQYMIQRFENEPHHSLAGNCLANAVMPSATYGGKSCSIKWKAAQQEKAILNLWEPGIQATSQGIPIRRCIGYDAGPKDSGRGAVEPKPTFDYDYPLRKWHINREDCADIIQAANLPLPDKSACTFCISSTPQEVLTLAKYYPDLAARAVAMEQRALTKCYNVQGLWRTDIKGTRSGKPRPASW